MRLKITLTPSQQQYLRTESYLHAWSTWLPTGYNTLCERIISTLTHLESLYIHSYFSVIDCHSQVLDFYSQVLDFHSQVLDFHSQVLDCHSQMLDCHSQNLDCHSQMLDCHSQVLDFHSRVVSVEVVEVPHITVTKKMQIIFKTNKITLHEGRLLQRKKRQAE